MPAIHIPQDAGTLRDYVRLARRLEASGYDRIWVGEVNDVDAVSAATLAATGTDRAQIALFFNVFTRAPTTLAMTASTLAQLAPGRAQIVLGVGSPLFVERWNGIPYRSVHERLRDTLRFLRLAMADGRVNEQFQTIPGSGFVMGSRPDPPPPILVAACGPRALALAASEADGVVLNWITPGDLERISPLPRHRRDVSIVVPACPTADREVMDRTMRPVVSNYLHVPAYAAQQRRLGRAGALEQMWSAWDRGDRATARAALPAAVLDEFIVWGDPAAIKERLDEVERRTGAGVIATFHLPEGMSFSDATGQA